MTATLVGFWGHLTLVAIERRIVYFCEVKQLYFVDQKELMLLRLELHIALHVFKKDLQAIFATATYVLPDIVFLPGAYEEGSSALQAVLAREAPQADDGAPLEGIDDAPPAIDSDSE